MRRKGAIQPIALNMSMDDFENDADKNKQSDLTTVKQSVAAYERARRGTSAVSEVSTKYRHLENLKVGSETIRTDEMVNIIVERLLMGDSLLSVTTDPKMPGYSTIMKWCRIDPDLRSLITWARSEGVQLLYDARQDIVAGGFFSTGDKDRDFELARTIKDIAAVRNRATFGDKVEVTTNSINYTVKRSDTDW